MSFFFGKYYYSLDAKGRIMIPAPLRDIITRKYESTKLFATNAAFDRCLHIYPSEEWIRLQEKVIALPRMEEAVTFFLRRVVASAAECEIDRQGRVLVPYEHRQDAGISAEVVIVGQIDKIELWDRAAWDAVTDPEKVDAKAYASVLAGYGL